ncbi:ROK family transcriptional regulator [Robertmurraya massiliosenegalensis]|uniref:ROK family transcriptional regulator n=1 Tax=Robertmurraya massiliosenegalensis TaxID=1287657 RepID=UPI000305ABF6|nr:ROK family protein [Robertmurraya massiliosenegalensis]
MKTWNQHVVKQENKTLVLNTIKQLSPISRAEIANLTGLNKGTVSSLVSELMEEQLIYESGPGESSGGRRPVMLLFNQVAGYSIGIDLGVNYLLGIVTDLQGQIFHEKTISFKHLTYEKIIALLYEMIDQLITLTPKSPYGIVGIGIGVPGTVSKDGKVLLAPNLNWRNINLKGVLQEKYNVPIIIENEANAGAYGEKLFGAGKEANNLVYVSVGIGIGVGLILNNHLYRGNNGFSGELGHMTINITGEKCGCGNKGCWELYASEQALLKTANKAGLRSSSGDEITLDCLLKLSKSGNELAIQQFENIGENLAVGINNIINIFNPQQIIIGNRMAAAEQWLKKPLEERMQARTLWFQQRDLEINFSELSTHSAALGVTAFVTENFFNSDLQEFSQAL